MTDDATIVAAKRMWAQRQINQVSAGGAPYMAWEQLPEKVQGYVIAEAEACLTGLTSAPRISLRDHLAACYMARIGAGGPSHAEADFKAALASDLGLNDKARARLAQIDALQPGRADQDAISRIHKQILTDALG